MVCPPSRGSCLPLSPFLFPFVAWCVRLPDGFVSPCLPLSPRTPFLFPFVGWCARLLEGLVSPCLPVVSLLASLCWMVRPPSRGSCLPLFPFVSWGASAFPRVLSPLVSSCLPLCPFVSPCVTYLPVGWCARRPQSLVSPCLPSCFPSGFPPFFPLLDGVCFLRVLSPLFSL